MVASDPVTEMLGARSTPIKTAPDTTGGTPALWTALPATKPGREIVDQIAGGRHDRAGAEGQCWPRRGGLPQGVGRSWTTPVR